MMLAWTESFEWTEARLRWAPRSCSVHIEALSSKEAAPYRTTGTSRLIGSISEHDPIHSITMSMLNAEVVALRDSLRGPSGRR